MVGLNKMSQCIIDQYNKLHGDGDKTNCDDVPDNGGIRVAYNAFMTCQAKYGADPRLPDAVLKQLTHEQIFFFTKALYWCNDDLERVDRTHSQSPKYSFGSGPEFCSF